MLGRWTKFLRAFAVLFACLLSIPKPLNAQERVALELVLAIDTSTSVDPSEYILQRDGIAAAFRHPQVHLAIEGLGAEGMAVTIVQWAGQQSQARVVNWQKVNSVESALQFAGKVSAMSRQMRGFTDIANAINFSVREIETNQFNGRRLTIDVSGDGTSDRNDPAIARDAAIRKGITVNGLIIHAFEYDLGDFARFELQRHYEQRVIGGSGAFLMHAENFRSFAQSMREKLFREIAGPQFAQLNKCRVGNTGLCRPSSTGYMQTNDAKLGRFFKPSYSSLASFENAQATVQTVP